MSKSDFLKAMNESSVLSRAIPAAANAVVSHLENAIGSGGATNSEMTDTYASDAAAIPEPNTRPANITSLPPLQLDIRNGQAFFLEFAADLSSILPPNGAPAVAPDNGGGQQTNNLTQQTYAPSWTVNLESLKNRIGNVDRGRYHVTYKFAVDTIYQKINAALAPDGTGPTVNNPNRAQLYSAEPIYLCADQLSAGGERYFVRVPPAQEYLANIDTTAFARIEELPCSLTFQYPVALNLLPFDRTKYNANSPRISGTRDVGSGTPMSAPFYSTQFVQRFNVRFKVEVNIEPNQRVVYSVANVENAIHAVEKQMAATANVGGSEGVSRSGGGAVGGAAAAKDITGQTSQDAMQIHLQELHDHFTALVGHEQAAADRYRQIGQMAGHVAQGVATAAQMAVMFRGAVGVMPRGRQLGTRAPAGISSDPAFAVPDGTTEMSVAELDAAAQSVRDRNDMVLRQRMTDELHTTHGFSRDQAEEFAHVDVNDRRAELGLQPLPALRPVSSLTAEQRSLLGERVGVPSRVRGLFGRVAAAYRDVRGRWQAPVVAPVVENDEVPMTSPVAFIETDGSVSAPQLDPRGDVEAEVPRPLPVTEAEMDAYDAETEATEPNLDTLVSRANEVDRAQRAVKKGASSATTSIIPGSRPTALRPLNTGIGGGSTILGDDPGAGAGGGIVAPPAPGLLPRRSVGRPAAPSAAQLTSRERAFRDENPITRYADEEGLFTRLLRTQAGLEDTQVRSPFLAPSDVAQIEDEARIVREMVRPDGRALTRPEVDRVRAAMDTLHSMYQNRSFAGITQPNFQDKTYVRDLRDVIAALKGRGSASKLVRIEQRILER